jgi:hypothetical protein
MHPLFRSRAAEGSGNVCKTWAECRRFRANSTGPAPTTGSWRRNSSGVGRRRSWSFAGLRKGSRDGQPPRLQGSIRGCVQMSLLSASGCPRSGPIHRLAGAQEGLAPLPHRQGRHTPRRPGCDRGAHRLARWRDNQNDGCVADERCDRSTALCRDGEARAAVGGSRRR